MEDRVRVQMLGGFSVAYGGRSVDDQANRMRKLWLLLAHMIFNRGRRITQEQYLSLLGTGSDAADPSGRLKAILYRIRAMLNQLEPGAGHSWIIRKEGNYAWNPDIPITLDAEQFESLCRAARETEDSRQRLELYRQGLALYRGDFLPKLSMEPWVMPINAYYHQMYLDAAGETLSLLEEFSLWEEGAALCRQALQVEPYSEELCQHLMRCSIAMGDRSAALQVYEEMSELLFSTFGVMPSDDSRALYREASRSSDNLAIPAGTLQSQLQEPGDARGVLCCEYDFFKMLYQVQARAIVRSGEVIHIALFSVRGRGQKELARRSLDRAVENLRGILIGGLRHGDVLSQCSVSQLIVMLPQANYENTCAVCQRILRAFDRQYPHSPAHIHYSVHPLEPHLPDGHAMSR